MILRLSGGGHFWYIDSMRVLFVADGRSPIAQNWIWYFTQRGDQVFLASTFACSPDLRLDGLAFVPVAFSGRGKSVAGAGQRLNKGLKLREAIRHWLGPLTIQRASEKLRGIIQQFKPELVHAMRIPYEGMLAADAYMGAPLVVSVWGNDFTLHARANALMGHYTSWTMQIADGLHTDCRRDVRMGKQWGYHPERPTLVSPGNGGIRTEVFHPPDRPAVEPCVINARGFRTYVRNDVFFQAIPQVVSRRPDARFLCVGMQGESEAERWVQRLGIAANVELAPLVPHAEMGGVLRRGQVTISLGIHDGTPNTLLEGMACGCLPVAGDLESIREWIEPGKNGLLVDPTDPSSVAAGILEGLENENLRRQAAGINQGLILERAEYTHCMSAAEGFYRRVMAAHTPV